MLHLSGVAEKNSPAPAACTPVPCTVLYIWLKDAARPLLAHVGGSGGLEQPHAPGEQGDPEANTALNVTPTFAAPHCHQRTRKISAGRDLWGSLGQGGAEEHHPPQAWQRGSAQGSSGSLRLQDTSAEAAA